MNKTLIGTPKIEERDLATMMNSRATTDGARWAVFQNHDLGSSDIGCLNFMAIGEKQTFKEVPRRMPDTDQRLGWRDIWVGWVNLETGDIIPKEDEVPPAPYIPLGKPKPPAHPLRLHRG